MASLRARPRKSIEDYLRLPEGTRAELIEGEIFMSPSPKVRHQRIVQRLFRLLDEHLRSRRLGEVYLAPLDVHLPSGDVVQPDVLVVLAGNLHIVRDWVRGVPDLVIEVLSSEAPERDRIVKRDLYARAGVAEYWIVDGDARAIEVLALAGHRYEPHHYVEAPGALTSRTLPDLEASLDDLFA